MNYHSIGNRRRSFWTRNNLPLLSFIFSALIMELAYISIGIFPYGPKDVLIIDLYHQYAPFLSELQDKFRSFSSLFYSWAGGLGTDFFSTYAYYLASPINLLLVLFPKSCLTEAVHIFILIKIGLSAAFFCIFLQRVYGKNNLSVVAFSMMYALSGYALAYSWDIMWLEGIYLMPLIFLGLVRLIKHEGALLYTISLGLLLFSNFYIAFFVVFFTVLYYPVLLIQFLPEKDFNSILKKTMQTGAFSILALGLSAVMILPTMTALKLTSAAGSSFPRDITEYFSLFDYIGRHFPFAEPAIRDGLPNIYCGLVSLMLAPVFFLSRKISKADKIAHAALLLILILSFNLNTLNFIWHGFHYPNQLPYRNALVYVFFLVTMAFRALDSKWEFTNRQWVGMFGLAAGLVILTQKLNNKTPGFPEIYLILVIIGIYAVVFTINKDKNGRSTRFLQFLFMAVAAELAVSTILVVQRIDNTEYYSTREGYLAGKEVSEMVKEIKTIESREKGFYRMEVTPPKTPNDGYLYNYNGVSIFSSMLPMKVVRTMENFGFHSNSINSYKYEGSTLPLDSFLGVKYLVRRSGQINETLKNAIYKKDKLTVYENPYALSIAYMTPSTIKKWYSGGSAPFPVQSKFIEAATGVRNMFSAVKVEPGTVSNAEVSLTDPYHFSVARRVKGSESRVTVNVKDVSNQNLYFYLETRPNLIDYGYIMVGNTRIDFNAKRSTMVDVGTIKAGTPVSIEIVYKDDSDLQQSFGIFADVLNEDNFKKAIDVAKGNSMQVEKFEDTYIKGTIDAKEAGVLFTTIPYHKGWSVWVDGKKTETFAIDDGFLAIDAAAGKHTIEMRYMTPRFVMGAVITGASVLIILLGIIFRIPYFRFKPYAGGNKTVKKYKLKAENSVEAELEIKSKLEGMIYNKQVLEHEDVEKPGDAEES